MTASQPMPGVLIRRKGMATFGPAAAPAAPEPLVRPPENDDEARTFLSEMALRLRRMATDGTRVLRSTLTLFETQRPIMEALAQYVERVSRLTPYEYTHYGRIVQPPRTGKTVLIGETVAATGCRGLILVPTQTLVEQHRDALAAQLPDLPVGVYYGPEKSLELHGLNIATYAGIQAALRQGPLPAPLRNVHALFLDEAHEAMTKSRYNAIRNAFLPHALRIGLTASPDYDDRRVLADFFPRLIHEMSIREARELNLMAPVFHRIRLVDETGAAAPRVMGGDFEAGELGDFMSQEPIFAACAEERFDRLPDVPALVCCASVKQAEAMTDYLRRHPAMQGAVGLIVGSMPASEKRETRRAFEAGELDTLVNVGVLLRGWNSPRCKHLIDLAPTLSRVRATQKFCRPLTKAGDRPAHITQIFPRDIGVEPYLPQDVFGSAADETSWPPDFEIWRQKEETARQTAEARKKRKPSKGRRAPVFHVPGASIDDHPLEVGLDPRNLDHIREVILWQFPNAAHSMVWRRGFEKQMIVHERFVGTGLGLLRYCGVRPRRTSYLRFMIRLWPALLSYTYLGDDALNYVDRWTQEDVDLLLKQSQRNLGERRRRDVCNGIDALSPMAFGDPLKNVTDYDLSVAVRKVLATLTPREEKIICMRFGIGCASEHTLEEVGVCFEVNRERIRQIEVKALRRLRHPSRSKLLRSFVSQE